MHRESPFASGPFVKVNCAAIPTDLLESELFGHEKGAYTGATGMRRGKFELADGGSILDEVGDLHAGSQAKLLRVLQEGEFHQVGGEQTVRVTVRVVAATNRDLNDMIAQGKFREDLYYRLCVVPIRVPSLSATGMFRRWYIISWKNSARATTFGHVRSTTWCFRFCSSIHGRATRANCGTWLNEWRS